MRLRWIYSDIGRRQQLSLKAARRYSLQGSDMMPRRSVLYPMLLALLMPAVTYAQGETTGAGQRWQMSATGGALLSHPSVPDYKSVDHVGSFARAMVDKAISPDWTAGIGAGYRQH